MCKDSLHYFWTYQVNSHHNRKEFLQHKKMQWYSTSTQAALVDWDENAQ
jgi:hypothetical protein